MQRFSGLTRREFLKLISLMPLGIYGYPVSKLKRQASTSPNAPALAPHLSWRTVPGGASVIMIVFDAWSQHH
jgi:hypothetical protein